MASSDDDVMIAAAAGLGLLVVGGGVAAVLYIRSKNQAAAVPAVAPPAPAPRRHPMPAMQPKAGPPGATPAPATTTPPPAAPAATPPAAAAPAGPTAAQIAQQAAAAQQAQDQAAINATNAQAAAVNAALAAQQQAASDQAVLTQVATNPLFLTVFEDINFGGDSQAFPPGEYTRLDAFDRSGDNTWGHCISSMKLPPHWVVYFYQGTEFTGGPPLVVVSDALTGNQMPYIGDAWNDQPMSMKVCDPIQPQQSREMIEGQHSEALRKFTAFAHIGGTIALSIFGLGALAGPIGTAESNAGLLPSQAGGNDANNIVVQDKPTIDELTLSTAVVYQQPNYQGAYNRYDVGSQTAPWPVMSYGIPAVTTLNGKTNSNANDPIGTSLQVGHRAAGGTTTTQGPSPATSTAPPNH